MKKQIFGVIDSILEMLVIYGMTSLASSVHIETSLPYMMLFAFMIISGTTLLAMLLNRQQCNPYVQKVLYCAGIALINPLMGLLVCLPVIFEYYSQKLHVEKYSRIVYAMVYGFALYQLVKTGLTKDILTDILWILALICRSMPSSLFTVLTAVFGIGAVSCGVSPVLMILCVIGSYVFKNVKMDSDIGNVLMALIAMAIHPYSGVLMVLTMVVLDKALPYLCKHIRYGERVFHGMRYLFIGVYALTVTYLCSNGQMTSLQTMVSIMAGLLWYIRDELPHLIRSSDVVSF